ncbi:MAG: protein-disulfide reductase DsbD family protein [Pseudohongiella sp.]|nr:protein-disulfide reductase DsbD family protein [Pseudohongiella sp.]
MQHWSLSVIKPDTYPHALPALIAGMLAFLLILLPSSGLAQSPFSASTSTPNVLSQQAAFLDVDQAFSFYISLDDTDRISVHWTIAPGYYLYADKFSFGITEPEDLVTTLIPVLPAGIKHEDEYFGEVSVYYEQTRAMLKLPDGSPQQFTLSIGFQGCAEAGLCYPPTKRDVEITQ